MSRIVKSVTYEARNVVLGPFYENDNVDSLVNSHKLRNHG